VSTIRGWILYQESNLRIRSEADLQAVKVIRTALFQVSSSFEESLNVHHPSSDDLNLMQIIGSISVNWFDYYIEQLKSLAIGSEFIVKREHVSMLKRVTKFYWAVSSVKPSDLEQIDFDRALDLLNSHLNQLDLRGFHLIKNISLTIH